MPAAAAPELVRGISDSSVISDEEEEEEEKEVVPRFARASTFSRSLRFARTRVSFSGIRKRLARSAEDVSKAVEEETPPPDPEAFLASVMAPEQRAKISYHDYNQGLDIEFERIKKENPAFLGLAATTATSSVGEESLGREESFNKRVSILEGLFGNWSQEPISEVQLRIRPDMDKVRRGVRDTYRRSVGVIRERGTRVEERAPPIKLAPLRAEQFVRTTRRTLILDSDSERCDCTVRDNDDGEIQFVCIASQEGIVCRNYKTTLDIVTIGYIHHRTEEDSVGVYYTIEGYRDGAVARILKGKTFAFSKTKYHLNLLSSDQKKLLIALPSPHLPEESPIPVLKQCLIVTKERNNIFKIKTKNGGLPVATVQKELSSQRYWLHIEPNVDSCFVSAIASYILRKKLFGDSLPRNLKQRNSLFISRARRLSLSLRRRKKGRDRTANTVSVRST